MYIDKRQQQEMAALMAEYLEATEGGTKKTPKGEKAAAIFFRAYADKIILGIIYAPAYRFWRHAELDDLIQEARSAILLSIHKRQWKPEKGTIFNFLSTVVSKNLINFTTRQNRHSRHVSHADVSKLYNNEDLTYREDLDRPLILGEAFAALRRHFLGKKKFERLTELLEQYYQNHSGRRFIKKDFSDYARAYGFSPAIVSTIFELAKRLGEKKHVRDLVDVAHDPARMGMQHERV